MIRSTILDETPVYHRLHAHARMNCTPEHFRPLPTNNAPSKHAPGARRKYGVVLCLTKSQYDIHVHAPRDGRFVPFRGVIYFQIHGASERTVVEPPVAGPCTRRPPNKRAVGRAGGLGRLSGARGRSSGLGKADSNALHKVRERVSPVCCTRGKIKIIPIVLLFIDMP